MITIYKHNKTSMEKCLKNISNPWEKYSWSDILKAFLNTWKCLLIVWKCLNNSVDTLNKVWKIYENVLILLNNVWKMLWPISVLKAFCRLIFVLFILSYCFIFCHVVLLKTTFMRFYKTCIFLEGDINNDIG